MRTTDATRRLLALIEALHPDGAVDDVDADSGRMSEPRPGIVVTSAVPAALAGDAIAWVTAPRLRRAWMRARLERHGFVVDGSWLPAPRSAARVLVPLTPVSGTVRRRLTRGVQAGAFWRIASRCNDRLLEELAPGVGLLVHARGARPPRAWLSECGVRGPVVISAGWHEQGDRLVLSGEGMTVKSSRAGAEHDPRLEATVLRMLEPAARRAGARVPKVLYDGPAGRRIALVEDTLPGARAAAILRKHPSRLDAFVAQVAGWIARWHVETRVARPFTESDLERFVLSPARALAPKLPHGFAYVERLEALGSSLYAHDVQFAAAHNDLTTWNLLVEDESFAVVDWEAAEHEALPLMDLEYFVVDAVSAARRVQRDAAFRRCAGDGPEGRLARRLRDELSSSLGLEPAVVELAGHACWLGHALNEDRRAAPGAPRPFLGIVALVAAR